MKPREIEIEYGYEGQLLWPPGEPSHKVSEKVLFREVVPIDWEKIWEKYDSKNWTQRINTVSKEDIQQLLEKQLAGEE